MEILNRDSYRIKPDERVFCVQCQCRLWPKDRVFPLGPDSFCSPACRQAFEHALETLADSDEIESTMAGSLACRLAGVVLVAACLAGCRVQVTVDRLPEKTTSEHNQVEQPQEGAPVRRTPWDWPS